MCSQTPLPIVTVLMIIISISGCSSLSKRDDLSALTKPVSMQLPAEKPQAGFAATAKRTTVRAAKAVGYVAGFVGVFIVDGVLDRSKSMIEKQ
jgi:hypothetical protein